MRFLRGRGAMISRSPCCPSATASLEREDIRAVDQSTGMALVRVKRPDATARTIWTPDRLDVARYFFAAAPAASRPAITPVYVSSLEPQRSPAWRSEIWRPVAPSGFPPGALVFTAAGEWLGIATIENGEPIIVPAAALLDLAAQLNQPRNPAGEFGLQVQHLDAKLGAEIGVPADSGVLVAWVDPRGVAADALPSVMSSKRSTAHAHRQCSRGGCTPRDSPRAQRQR